MQERLLGSANSFTKLGLQFMGPQYIFGLNILKKFLFSHKILLTPIQTYPPRDLRHACVIPSVT